MIALFKFSENYENKKDLRNIHRIINYKIIKHIEYISNIDKDPRNYTINFIK